MNIKCNSFVRNANVCLLFNADKKDVVGSHYFQDANGNVFEGTIINIRQVDF